MSPEDIAASADGKAVSDGILDFSLDLMKTVHQENENLIFSPLSISAALSLAYLGAAGNTRKEIGKLLRDHTENRIAEFHKTICSIMERVIVNDEGNPFGGVVVSLANGIFMQERLKAKPSYLTDATTLYKSEVTKVDFEGNGNETIAKINGWVSEKTKGRITQLFNASLSTDTLVLLVNTLYFVSSWYEEFSVGATKMEKFFTGKEEIMVPMMHNEDNVPYMNNKSLQFEAIPLRYSGSGYEMCIILPYANQPLHNLINNLTLKNVQEIIAGGHDAKVDYKIPRFKFSSSLSLKNTLLKLGMQEAFNKADFSNMMDASACLADVTHAAEIEVDEKGTIASAATAVRLVPCSAYVDNSQPIPFHADRPFMSLLCHRPTSTILFSVTVYQPTDNSVPQQPENLSNVNIN